MKIERCYLELFLKATQESLNSEIFQLLSGIKFLTPFEEQIHSLNLFSNQRKIKIYSFDIWIDFWPALSLWPVWKSTAPSEPPSTFASIFQFCLVSTYAFAIAVISCSKHLVFCQNKHFCYFWDLAFYCHISFVFLPFYFHI